MTPSQSQQPPGGGRRATRQGFLGGAVDLGGQGQDDQDGMNPSQGFSCRGQAGKDSLVTTKKTPGGDFLVVRLDSGDETRATKWTLFILGGDFLVGAMAWMTKRPEKKMVVRLDSGAETRATERPGEDLVVRLDSWDETRATKWTLFILGGDFLVGAMAWMTKRPEKKMVVRLDSGAETRATISCWEVAGMPPSEAMALMTWRTGFPLRIGNMSHGRQLPGGGRGATRRVHLGGVDGLGGQGQRGSQMLPAGRGL